jgi:hypothetical protein
MSRQLPSTCLPVHYSLWPILSAYIDSVTD